MLQFFFVVAIPTVALAWLAHRRWRQTGARWARLFAWLLPLSFVESSVVSMAMLWRAFTAIANDNPAEKASHLARGISVAMNYAASHLVVLALAVVALTAAAIADKLRTRPPR